MEGNVQPLDQKQKSSLSGSINSVIYFATLPHKLMDLAFIKNYIGQDQINNKNYEVLPISFSEKCTE